MILLCWGTAKRPLEAGACKCILHAADLQSVVGPWHAGLMLALDCTIFFMRLHCSLDVSPQLTPCTPGLMLALDCKPAGAALHLYGYNWSRRHWRSHAIAAEERVTRLLVTTSSSLLPTVLGPRHVAVCEQATSSLSLHQALAARGLLRSVDQQCKVKHLNRRQLSECHHMCAGGPWEADHPRDGVQGAALLRRLQCRVA